MIQYFRLNFKFLKGKYKLLFILISALFIGNYESFGVPINSKTASEVAKNFYFQRIIQFQNLEYQNIIIESEFQIKKDNQVAIYIFNIKNHGFIMISGDDAAIPVIAYDFENQYSTENQSPAFIDWIEVYAKQIQEIWKNNLQSDRHIDSLWNSFKEVNSHKFTSFNGKTQAPLLISNWDQGAKYNAQCPADQFGPGGHAYAGCVAVAMAQIMYYYKYPSQGNSSYSFYDQNYGLLSANFGNTNYKWNEMANQMPTDGNFEIAQLLYHCGVSVDMNYTASGSGAWSNNVVSALKDYFYYDNSITIENKSSYTDSQWSTMIINNLDNKIPLYYHGYPAAGGAGHAFNLDGYQGNDYFHFNWGWSGSYNGYFYLNNLNPGNYDFASWQGGIFNTKPLSSNYPIGCQNNTLFTTKQGVIFDGSGPEDYTANRDCQWNISPTILVDYIEIEFNKIALGVGDTITIYDGNSITSPIIAQLDAASLPGKYYSTSSKMLVRFKTDGMYHADGFDASFKSILPTFCHGTLVITDSAGLLTDGSDTNNYNNGVLCKWMIDSPLNKGISLQFTKFDTEDGEDWVKIYDPSQSPSLLLGQFSGNQIPPVVSANNGKMLIIFASNQAEARQGWEAQYFTGNVGITQNYINSEISIFPNPANQYLIINGLDANIQNKINIYNLEGKLVLTGESENKNQIKINTEKLKSGVYILKISNKIETIHKRIEIQN